MTDIQTPAVEPVETPAEEVKTTTAPIQSKEEVLARLDKILETGEEVARQDLDILKNAFYRLQKQETEEAYKAYIAEGGNPDEYVPAPLDDEAQFKAKMNLVKEKRAKAAEELERQKEENYNTKLDIIEKIKAMLATPDEVNKNYNDFKQLQEQWNEIKLVPADKATDLWKTYQMYVEQFYDNLKINNELRAYDFKKNLELKTALCEKAEALASEEDVVAAFRTLQQLHQDFREIGPVASELREEIWTRFKNASTVVNKRHQDFFESRKQKEEDNLAQKTAICEQVEGLDLSALKTFADWNALTEKVIELQAQWKTIGFAPQKMNVQIFERFRNACDEFFNRKQEYFKSVRSSLNDNYEKKLALVEKAESLKDSQDWKATTDILVDLQKQWKEIGTVPKKVSEDIWKRFNDACDAFFAAKKEATSGQRQEQVENLNLKKAIIDRLAAINPENLENELRDKLREAQDEWNKIGHVPFKDKDKLYKAFREQMDRLYGAANENATRRRVNKFKNDLAEGDTSRIRERLLRQREILTNELKTYENNLGFLNLGKNSKGNGLVEELNRKMNKLKSDLEEVKEKLAVLKKSE
ncbi:MAG: DUF349 domain-containing protein [Bacteroidaceae bacterium]|nr:DUF349 domain-containing protein [Bacteroidaceae bacterium]